MKNVEIGKSDTPMTHSGHTDLYDQLKHPLLSRTIVLPTVPIAELVTTLVRVVKLREQGCCFSATSGFGKSMGLTLAEKELRLKFPGVPIFRHIVNNHQVPSIRAFFKHFLTTVGVSDIKGETYDLRLRLINRLTDYGRESPLKLIVILIDEAQGMSNQDFAFLKDIGNELERIDVQLVVAMMGQDPDFGDMINNLRDQGRLDLVSRFALRQLFFRGLQTVADFTQLLEFIDRQTYPAKSACTWPEFFAPRLWREGFRMKDQVNLLMAAIDARLQSSGGTQGTPARQLFLATRRFLLDLSEIDREGGAIPDTMWGRAIEYALVEEAATVARKAVKKNPKKKVTI